MLVNLKTRPDESSEQITPKLSPKTPPETTLKGYPIYRGPILPKTNHNSRRSRFPLDELEVGQYFFLATEKEACAVRSAAYVMKRKGSEKQFSVTAQVSNETGQLQWVAQRIA